MFFHLRPVGQRRFLWRVQVQVDLPQTGVAGILRCTSCILSSCSAEKRDIIEITEDRETERVRVGASMRETHAHTEGQRERDRELLTTLMSTISLVPVGVENSILHLDKVTKA